MKHKGNLNGTASTHDVRKHDVRKHDVRIHDVRIHVQDNLVFKTTIEKLKGNYNLHMPWKQILLYQ